MKYDEKTTAGSGTSSARNIKRPFILIACLLLFSAGFAQSLYKYRGENGEWIYTDRPPEGDDVAEIRDLPQGDAEAAVTVTYELVDEYFTFVASNDFHAPVEIDVSFESLVNLNAPEQGEPYRWVVPARSRAQVMQLEITDKGLPARADFRYAWLLGDPDSDHRPAEPYRAPFAVATDFMVTQAYPSGVTHRTPDSIYAVDLGMPIGTDVHAARAGTVFDTTSSNFRGGLDPNRDIAAANLVRILHDDGTYAVYAHLNRSSIRVSPGDFVERGEYIADSGNTGFTSGPHLHFAVIKNRGMELESVPVVFEGPNNSEIQPETSNVLIAY